MDFPDVPAEFLRKLLKLQGTLYSAYLELYRIDSKYDSANPPPYIRLRSGVKRTGSMPPFKNVYIPDAHKDVLPVEFQDARNARICKEGWFYR